MPDLFAFGKFDKGGDVSAISAAVRLIFSEGEFDGHCWSDYQPRQRRRGRKCGGRGHAEIECAGEACIIVITP